MKAGSSRRLRPKSSSGQSNGASELDKRIAELRQMQKLAIKNNDFETAEEIENQITTLKNETKDAEYDNLLVSFEQKAHEILDASLEIVATLADQQKTEEHDYRVRINQLFETLRDEQIKALIDLEKDFAASRLRETERRISEQDELLAKAQHAATLRRFEEAKKLREAAQVVAEADLQCRLAKADDNFELTRKAVMKQQKEAIEALSNKLVTGLSKIAENTALKIAKEEELRVIRIKSHLDEYSRLFGTAASNRDDAARVKELESKLIEILEQKECAVPKGIGANVRTKPGQKH